MTTAEEFGPQFRAIARVVEEQVPALNKLRTELIFNMARSNERTEIAQRHAFEAARLAGDNREEKMVRASEYLRKSIWDIIWDSTWADAWQMSWIISRCALGIATHDLIGTGNYTVEDYSLLVSPWLLGGRWTKNLWTGEDEVA